MTLRPARPFDPERRRSGPPKALDGIRAKRTSPRPTTVSPRFPNGMHTYSWQVDRALFDELAKAATAQERSMSALLRIIVREYLEGRTDGPA